MTKNALSKEALKRYPIGKAETQSVGPHTLSTFDFENGEDYSRLAKLILPASFDLVYVDPPWGPGLASGYRTKAEMENRKADYATLRRRLVTVILSTGAPFVLEMGDNWVGDWMQAFQHIADLPIALFETKGTYYKKHPMTYIVGKAGNNARAILDALRGANDDASPGLVMDALKLQPGSVVFDPMCGRGCTARHAVKRGLTFVGNELAPYRAAATLEILSTPI